MSNASSIDGPGIENILPENLQFKNSEWRDSGSHDGPVDLVRILRQRAKLSPEKNVFSFLEEDGKVGQAFSYADLDLRARMIATKLAASGKPGDRVLLLYPPSLEFIAGFFGCLYAGMIAVPAYPPKNNRHMVRLKAIMDDADSVLALTKQALSEKIRKLALEQRLDELNVISSDDLGEAAASEFEPLLPVPDQIAFLQYTSGSTGSPKGVMVSHGNLAHNSSLIQRTWGHSSKSVMVSWLPLFHDLGLIAGVLQPVFAGFPSVLMAPATFLQKPLLWLQAISHFKGTSSCAPNFAYDYCVKKISAEDMQGLDLSSWELALNAAEPIRHKTLTDFCEAFRPAGFRPGTFFPGYGLAEGTLQVCVSKLGRGAEVFLADAEALESNHALLVAPGAKSRSVVGCGHVLEDAQILIVDPHSCRALGADAVGEVWIAGPSVAQGYWRNPDATQEIFKARLEGGTEFFLRTGDLGFISQGELFLTGRCKDLLIIRGRNHYPQDLEQSAEFSHNALRSNGGAAFSVEHSGEERVVLVHEIERNREGETNRILEAIKKALLRDHEVSPHAIVLIKTTSLPKTSSGKIQRRATKKAFLEGSLDVISRWDEGSALAHVASSQDEAAPAAAEGEAFHRLAALVSLKLKLDLAKIGASDTLQSLGMDSLSLIEFKHALEESFGMDCLLEELLEGPTLLELSRRLAVSLPESGEFRLTPAQESLWFFEQLHTGAPLYNIAAAWQLEGALDAAALQKGLEEILRRHEALRTGFRNQDGTPSAFVAQSSAWDWQEQDLSGLEPAAADQERERLCALQAAQRFDLELPPLFKARLYHLPGGRHALLLVVHHLVSDGWSFKLLWEELSELYDSFHRGIPAKLKALTRSFADWAEGAESRGSLQSLDYWKSKFSDLPARLDLPGDRPLPSQQDFRGGSFSFDLDEAFSRKLKGFSKELGSNSFGVFLAAYQVLLQRLSRQRDFCVGVPVANRSSRACSQIMGYFVNTLALRQSVDPAQSFRQHLSATQDNLKNALGHQDLPFERLVRELGVEPDPSGHPLFQSLLVFQGPNPAPQHLDSLKVSALDVPSGSAKLDLAISLEERHGCFHGVIEYRLDLFDPETISRWADHYQMLLESALAAPDLALDDLKMLKPQEAWQVLAFAIGEHRPLSASNSFKNLFERGVRQHPSAQALRWKSEVWSYAELNQRANQLAHALQAWGIGKESMVALCFERGPQSVLAALAVLKAGGAFLPLDPSYPKERLDFILKDAAAVLLLTQDALQAKQGLAVPRTICLDTQWERISHFSSEDPIGLSQPSDLAYVIYTSGSTGTPKGVQLEQLGLWNLVQTVGLELGLALGSRVLQFASPSFDASVWEIFPTLAHGACLVLASSEQTRDPQLLTELCQKDLVEVATLPPSLLQHLLPQSLPTLRCLVSAGESCTAELARLWSQGRRFINAYGPTESTVCSSLQICDPQSLAAPSIGRPLANLRTYVVDEGGHLQALGVPGELWIGGAGIARGYLGRPELTGEKFIEDPFAAGAGKLFCSGDLARWRPDGNLEFMGRMDSQVKLRGFRIELGEVEAVLSSLPGVREVAVMIQGSGQTAHLAAYLAVEPGMTEEALRLGAAARLPEFMLPSAFCLMERLPLNINGKVDRTRLISLSQKSKDSVEESAGQLELALKVVFAEVLGISEAQVSMEKSFFSMGGHSLLALKLLATIQRQFGVKLDLAKIFEKPTVMKLAPLLVQPQTSVLECLPKSRGVQKIPSLGQEAFWFFEQLRPGTPIYNMPVAWRMKGRLDFESLRAALGDLLQRHASLRTVFSSEAGRPVPRQIQSAMLPVEMLDLEAFPASSRLAQLNHSLQEDLASPFDLANGPLLRARLYRLEARDHALLLNFHHICADGWSLQVLMSDLKEIYEARLQGRKTCLPELSHSYDDYSAWQRAWLDSPEAEKQRSYWQQQLAGAPAILELPWDRLRPALQSFKGSSVPLLIPAELTRDLGKFCTDKGCTLHSLLLTAFLSFLRRASGQDDVIAGIPVANRRHQESEGLVGLFMNTLAIRYKAEGEPSFEEATKSVFKTCLEAYAHQDLPFEKVVETLKLERDSSCQPLVQAMLAFQGQSSISEEMGSLSLEGLELASCASRFDLTLHLQEKEGVIEGCLEYSSDLFDAATARRWARHFVLLLQDGVRHPQARLSELALLSKDEEKVILSDWNQTQAAYPQQACVQELFEEQAALRPNAIALSFGSQKISYGELNRRSNCLAWKLRGMGVGPESLVGLFTDRTPEALLGMLAVLKAGGAYVPLDPSYPQDRLDFMLQDSAPTVILTQSWLEARIVKSGYKILCLDALEVSADDSNPNLLNKPCDLAYVIFTSGSTGRPKGVMVEHRGICRLARNERYSRVQAGDVVAQMASHSFDMSTDEIWSALANGAELVIVSKEDVLDHRVFEGIIRSYAINTMTMATPIFNHLVSQNPRIFSTLKTLVLGGEALDPKWIREVLEQGAPESLINAYGPTECTVWATSEELFLVPKGASSVPIGKPISNDQAFILDKHLRPVPVGMPGELYLGGAGLARGYLKRSDLTAEKFILNPFDSSGQSRLYRTGDLARWLEGGRIDFIGRMDNQVKVNGHRIELGEIESVLSQCQGIRNAAVLALNFGDDDKRLLAYLEPESGFSPNPEELQSQMRARLPRYMVPARILFLERLPLNSNGKVDRKALAGRGLPEEAPIELSLPMDALEFKLLELWRDLLKVQKLSLQDNFFDLGGNSLLAVQLCSKISKALGCILSLGELLQNPQVDSLAALLRNRGIEGLRPNAIVTLRSGGSQVPLFLVHPIGGSVYCYAGLAAQMGVDRPIYAFESMALSGSEPAGDLMTLAQEYVSALREKQPVGPYHLGGWSFGGVVAFEMARILEAQGQVTEFLCLLDSSLTLAEEKKKIEDDPALLAGLFIRDLAGNKPGLEFSDTHYRSLGPQEQLEYLTEVLGRAEALPEGMGIEELRRLLLVFKAHAKALARYQPGFYGGRLTLVLAEEGLRQHCATQWASLCGKGLELYLVAGDHYGLLSMENCSGLSFKLKASQGLAEASTHFLKNSLIGSIS